MEMEDILANVLAAAMIYYRNYCKKTSVSPDVKVNIKGTDDYYSVFLDGEEALRFYHPLDGKIKTVLRGWSDENIENVPVSEATSYLPLLLSCHIYVWKHIRPHTVSIPNLSYSIYYVSPLVVEIGFWTQDNTFRLEFFFSMGKEVSFFFECYEFCEYIDGEWTPQAQQRVFRLLDCIRIKYV